MLIRAYKHARLMEESELRVEVAARSGPPEEMLVASRILSTPPRIACGNPSMIA